MTMMTVESPANNKDLLNSSDFRSKAWKCQQSAWEITADLWESAIHIREKQKAYLEQFEKEPDKKYAQRLSRSVFNNEFRKAIETMAGMVFKSDPAPDGAPPPLADLFPDVDGCGNSLHSFLLKAFEMFLRDGDGYFFVDSPKAPEDSKTLTVADRADDRPICIFYEARQVISKRTETINGKEVLTQAVIEEEVLVADGLYGEKPIKRHRILRQGSYEIEIYDEDNKKWIPDPDDPGGQTGLTDIPLVSFAEYGSTPPLLVLAMLNILYYNKISDFDDWCHMACVPERVYHFDSFEDAEKFSKVNDSASVARKIWGKDAKVYFNEVTGAGLNIAKERNTEIANEMKELGVGMLAPEALATRTATEVMDTAGQRQSKLARFAREFENAVEKMFYFMAEQLNMIQPNAVNLDEAEDTALALKLDFDRLTFSTDQMTFFSNLLAAGDISHETFWELFSRVWDMPEGWTPELEKLRLTADEPVVSAVQMPNELGGKPPVKQIGAIQ